MVSGQFDKYKEEDDIKLFLKLEGWLTGSIHPAPFCEAGPSLCTVRFNRLINLYEPLKESTS